MTRIHKVSGVGNDIIEVERIQKAIDRHGQHFLDRIFTKLEQEYCNRYQFSARHYAGRFAAKEAVVKAIGVGFREGVHWVDIEILNDANGKPEIHLSSDLNSSWDFPELLLSISHCQDYASAVVIWSR